MPKASKKRELLFCVTQPVSGGWLTSSVVLQLDFTPDKGAPRPGEYEHASTVEDPVDLDLPRGTKAEAKVELHHRREARTADLSVHGQSGGNPSESRVGEAVEPVPQEAAWLDTEKPYP